MQRRKKAATQKEIKLYAAAVFSFISVGLFASLIVTDMVCTGSGFASDQSSGAVLYQAVTWLYGTRATGRY